MFIDKGKEARIIPLLGQASDTYCLMGNAHLTHALKGSSMLLYLTYIRLNGCSEGLVVAGQTTRRHGPEDRAPN